MQNNTKKTKILFDQMINKMKILGDKSVKIPSMGFTDHYVKPDSTQVGKSESEKREETLEKTKASDHEILESTKEIYFDSEVNTSKYELDILEKCSEEELAPEVQERMNELKRQLKVVSKKVLQLILEQRNNCNEEFSNIGETEKMLQESVWICRKARSYLSFAQNQLTTTNLEILATYKKRQVLAELLQTLHKIKKLKSMDQHLQQQLAENNYSQAISTLLSCREFIDELQEYKCVESLAQKLKDTQMLAEVELDKVLNEMCLDFDAVKYSKLQEAYSFLGKTSITMDQLHINFISTIHSMAFNLLRNNLDSKDESNQKMLFEELCENIRLDKYVLCLIALCKSFWTILSCYYQIIIWHRNHQPNSSASTNEIEIYIQEKLKNGQIRIWNDIQSKICIYLKCSKLHQLKFEQIIQILSVVQKLKKVGHEFCGDNSQKLMDTIRVQSEAFFSHYHSICLDEIGLFLENEAWVCIDSFLGIKQLQEFRTVKKLLKRFNEAKDGQKEPTRPCEIATLKLSPSEKTSKIDTADNDSSIHSQDAISSIDAFCGYFMRFSEKSTPFDGGFDEQMLQEDILAGIADESSCYFSEESDEEQFGGPPSNQMSTSESTNLIVNNTMLTVLRCIGRYVQMCRMLHSIAPQIIVSMTELIDFYIFVVHEFFAKDLNVSSENLYSPALNSNLQRIFEKIIPKVNHWPPSRAMIDPDINNPDEMFGFQKRVVAIESGVTLLDQFEILKGYLSSLLPPPDKVSLSEYIQCSRSYVMDLRKPIYICIAARFVDIQSILIAMSKVKFDLNHVTVQCSQYVDIVNRIIQTFAMRLEEQCKVAMFPQAVKEDSWDYLAHVLTHVLVEGFSNAKKCSTGGRALMQLDFTHILSFLELISGISKFPTHQQYVDQYVKAYYMAKDDLENWMREQIGLNNYSGKQLQGLILCACANDKKTRLKLMAMVGGGTASDN